MSDETLTVYPNTLGIKIGSKWTVAYGKPIGEEPRIELTCIRKVPTHMIKDDFGWQFSRDAEPYDGSIFPLIHGAPRNDKEVPLGRSCLLLKKFAEWLLKDVEEETGIVFCLPMIKYEEGLEALKTTLRDLSHGEIGIEFLGEARSATIGSLPINEVLSTQTLSLNLGSSTLEVDFYSGKQRINNALWTFGGSDIDRRLVNAIEMEYRGLTATENQARQIKERYNYNTNEDIPAELTREGGLVEELIKGNTIRTIVDDFAKNVAKKVRTFLRETRTVNTKAVNALQIEGKGYLALVGGMVNMPGFAERLYQELTDTGGISKNVEMVSADDGVVAPAVGAWKAANLFEEYRREQNVSTWSDIQ